MKIVTVG